MLGDVLGMRTGCLKDALDMFRICFRDVFSDGLGMFQVCCKDVLAESRNVFDTVFVCFSTLSNASKCYLHFSALGPQTPAVLGLPAVRRPYLHFFTTSLI